MIRKISKKKYSKRVVKVTQELIHSNLIIQLLGKEGAHLYTNLDDYSEEDRTTIAIGLIKLIRLNKIIIVKGYKIRHYLMNIDYSKSDFPDSYITVFN